MKLRKIKPDFELQKKMIVANPVKNASFVRNFKKKNSLTLNHSPMNTQRSMGSILREAANQNDSEGDTISENMYKRRQH